MSGTTGVIALIRDGTAHVANLGDSRAIIGWWTDAGEIEGEAISEDHVPSRKDEYERVRGGSSFLPRVRCVIRIQEP